MAGEKDEDRGTKLTYNNIWSACAGVNDEYSSKVQYRDGRQSLSWVCTPFCLFLRFY